MNRQSTFTAECRSLLSQAGDLGKHVHALATYSLDLNQLTRLSRTIRDISKSGGSLAPLTPFKLAVLSNSRPGIDPYAFEREFAEIAARHDIVNIDPDSEFGRYPNATNLFYPVNGHLTEEENSVFEQALVRGLLSSDLAIFSGCSLAHGSAR